MDERLALLEKEKQQALNTSNNTYNNLLQDNQNIYNQQLDYANQFEKTQNEALDKQLAFNQEQINKQKEKANQNMRTESIKAKNDYTAFNNPYGLQAEAMASTGLLNSGVSETAKLGSFNTYQNRLAYANKAMQDAFVQYDTELNQARLNNDVQKAQNALAKLEMQLQYSQNYYDNKSSLTQNQLGNNQNLNSEYNNQYNTVYNQIQAQRQFEEQVRQYNEQMAYQKQQDVIAQANWEKEYALSKKAISSSSGGYPLTNNGENQSANNTILTDYYNGPINPDTKYGTFGTKDKNGVSYQPDNVNGNKLSNSGHKVGKLFVDALGKTGADLSNQSIWTTNGKYYVWDGSINDYIDVTSKVNNALTTYGPHRW